MNKTQSNPYRILAIAPSTRGFGFAVLEGQDTLVDWGVKPAQGNKNAQSLAKAEELMAHYQPGVLVLPNTKDSRRSARIKALIQNIISMAATRNVRVELFSQEQLRRAFFAEGQGTKHAIAERVAQRFPDELASRLPPKRKPWVSEHYQMAIFEAVALVMVFRLKYAKRSRAVN
jgi:Holliday junction resolvasome RuvABC endonuclease subunit